METKGAHMKSIRFLVPLLASLTVLALFVLISSSCSPYFSDEDLMPPTRRPTLLPASQTIELGPTQTARPSPSGNYCEDATSAGARIRYTFAEILPCLDTIEEVSRFMQNNMQYDNAWDTRERGGNEYVPAWLVYERGVDDCDGHAILQCYFLEMNDRDAVILGLNVDTDSGHNVCAVNTGEAIIVLDNMGEIVGPFTSIEEAALHYIDPDGHLGILLASQVTQITTDETTPSVLDLPWHMIWKSP